MRKNALTYPIGECKYMAVWRERQRHLIFQTRYGAAARDLLELSGAAKASGRGNRRFAGDGAAVGVEALAGFVAPIGLVDVRRDADGCSPTNAEATGPSRVDGNI